MIERYVEAASTYASEIDDLVLLITVLVGFWFLRLRAVLLLDDLPFPSREGQEDRVHHR